MTQRSTVRPPPTLPRLDVTTKGGTKIKLDLSDLDQWLHDEWRRREAQWVKMQCLGYRLERDDHDCPRVIPSVGFVGWWNFSEPLLSGHLMTMGIF